MSIKALQEYTRYAKYAKFLPEKQRRETWDEQVDRVFDMHAKKLGDKLELIKDDFEFAKNMMRRKRILGSQRALQFGGEPILKKNVRIYNCFDKNTKFITNKGTKSFKEFNDGDDVTVLSGLGNWKPAKVKSYGEQSLNKIIIKRGLAEYTINATKNHRWILKDGSETTNLKVGDSLQFAPNITNSEYDDFTPFQKLYWCYGYVYGDGTKLKNKKGEYVYSMVRLCKKDSKYQNRFTEMGFKTNTNLSLNGDFFAYTGSYLKTCPNLETDSKELIYAFIKGYLAADGNKNRSNDVLRTYESIQSSEKSHIEFLRKALPMCGYYIVSEKDLTGEETNFGIRPYTIQFRIINTYGKTAVSFKVDEIIENIKTEMVWCLEVEDDKSFVLPHGFVTGNCCASYCDRPRFFQEALFNLLAGTGVGFSVQLKDIEKLPTINKLNDEKVIYNIEDSIEGWSDALGILVSSYFTNNQPFEEYFGKTIQFNFDKIRPSGSPLSWGGKAPGPNALKKSLEKIKNIFEIALNDGRNKLKPIEAYDIVMHASDGVISGGVRRSATICLFSPFDEEMCKAKTGDWFIKNPQRGRSNNSAILVRNKTTKEEFNKLFKSTKEFGEPGFVWAENDRVLFNPCCEISLYGYTEDSESGWEFCNLCTINMKKCKTEQDFFDACKASSILGTIQAMYTDFPYLGNVTEKIVRREALLGCSITGFMDNPEIALNPKIQKNGAEIIVKENEKISKILGINAAARVTTVKPEGSASCLLGSSSGIHPHHAKRYIRRVQANKSEFPLQYFKLHNPKAIEESVWSQNKTDDVISFLCEVPEGARVKTQIGAIELLKNVMSTQQNWIEYGTTKRSVQPWLRHNVSNTITVKDSEWDEVEKFIYDNKQWFAGISLLPASGDLDYPQAPFSTILTEKEIILEFGEGALFASGLIVDGQHAFDNNLWKACDSALGIGEKLELPVLSSEPTMPIKNGYTNKVYTQKLKIYTEELTKFFNDKEKYDKIFMKLDWNRRFQQFSDRYVEGNLRKCCHLLKYVSLWKLWLDLKREYVDVDWSLAVEEEYSIDMSTIAGAACQGGACEIGDLGDSIKSAKENK